MFCLVRVAQYSVNMIEILKVFSPLHKHLNDSVTGLLTALWISTRITGTEKSATNRLSKYTTRINAMYTKAIIRRQLNTLLSVLRGNYSLWTQMM